MAEIVAVVQEEEKLMPQERVQQPTFEHAPVPQILEETVDVLLTPTVRVQRRTGASTGAVLEIEVAMDNTCCRRVQGRHWRGCALLSEPRIRILSRDLNCFKNKEPAVRGQGRHDSVKQCLSLEFFFLKISVHVLVPSLGFGSFPAQERDPKLQLVQMIRQNFTWRLLGFPFYSLRKHGRCSVGLDQTCDPKWHRLRMT